MNQFELFEHTVGVALLVHAHHNLKNQVCELYSVLQMHNQNHTIKASLIDIYRSDVEYSCSL